MRAVVQRVSRAAVKIGAGHVAHISEGLCCLVGVAGGDGPTDVEYMARKICGLRIFEDEQGRMNLDVNAIAGGILLISQFTLLGDARNGRRPSFSEAARPEVAARLFDDLAIKTEEMHPGKVVTGIFQAMMAVELVNNGPVTILLDSRRLF